MTELVKIHKSLRHPSILGLMEYFTHDFSEGKRHVFVMEKPGGLSLRAHKAQGRIFTEDEAIRVLYQVSDAVAYCHSQNPSIVHRDINDEVVYFLPDNGAAILGGFWCARLLSKSQMLRGAVGVFKAPEMASGDYDESVDVYSLGCTVISLLSNGPVSRPVAVPPNLRPELADFLGSMVGDRGRRPTMAQVCAFCKSPSPVLTIPVVAPRRPILPVRRGHLRNRFLHIMPVSDADQPCVDIGDAFRRLGSAPDGWACPEIVRKDCRAVAGCIAAELNEVDGIFIGGRDNPRDGSSMRPLDLAASQIRQFYESGGVVIFLHEALTAAGEWKFFADRLGLERCEEPPPECTRIWIVAQFGTNSTGEALKGPYRVLDPLRDPEANYNAFRVAPTHCSGRLRLRDPKADDFPVWFYGARGPLGRFLLIKDRIAFIETGNDAAGRCHESEARLLANLVHHLVEQIPVT